MSNKLEKFRRLILGHCQRCKRQFFQSAGRPRLYCRDACRQGAFRDASRHPSRRNETQRKTRDNSSTSKAVFAGRPSPLNVLGNSHRWPNSVAINRETLTEIIGTEVPERRINGGPAAIAKIPQDLSIPDFLRRGSQ